MIVLSKLSVKIRRAVVDRSIDGCRRAGYYPWKVAIPHEIPVSFHAYREDEVGAMTQFGLAHELVADALLGLEDRVRALLLLMRQMDGLVSGPCPLCGGGHMLRDLVERIRDGLPNDSPNLPRIDDLMDRARPFLHATNCPLLELRTRLHEMVYGETPTDLNPFLPVAP